MAKPIYHGKSHGIWVLPCNGFSHSSMAKPMDIIKRNIHGFCHGPLLHGFCHGAFKRKLPLCFQSAWNFFCIAPYCYQILVFRLRLRFSFWYGNLKEAKKKVESVRSCQNVLPRTVGYESNEVEWKVQQSRTGRTEEQR